MARFLAISISLRMAAEIARFNSSAARFSGQGRQSTLSPCLLVGSQSYPFRLFQLPEFLFVVPGLPIPDPFLFLDVQNRYFIGELFTRRGNFNGLVSPEIAVLFYILQAADGIIK
ncbi:MAG: hypothetical protein HWD58_11800 [Bacteroidota bacterium]|nr:MAG: hypothetical protein HWD58_11800 [Bacteroidota bacterium]